MEAIRRFLGNESSSHIHSPTGARVTGCMCSNVAERGKRLPALTLEMEHTTSLNPLETQTISCLLRGNKSVSVCICKLQAESSGTDAD